MNCISCPYTEIVRDEKCDRYMICCFSRSCNFLREVNYYDSCECDEEIKKTVYMDDEIHGHCLECKYFEDDFEPGAEECLNCISNGGTDDHWKWGCEE